MHIRERPRRRDAISAAYMIEVFGIAILIFLPVLRVALMLWTFVRRGEHGFAGLAALVPVIIAASTLLSLRAGSAG